MIESVTTLLILLLASVELNCFLFLIMLDNQKMYRTRLLQVGIRDSGEAARNAVAISSGEEDTVVVTDASEREQSCESSPKPAREPDDEQPIGELVKGKNEASTDSTDSVGAEQYKEGSEKDGSRPEEEEESSESPFSEYFRKLRSEIEEKEPETVKMCLRLLKEKREKERALLRGKEMTGEQAEGQTQELAGEQSHDQKKEDQEIPGQEEQDCKEVPDYDHEQVHEPESLVEDDGTDKDTRIRTYTRMKAGPFMVHGMSVQGRGHLIDAIPCQDYHYVDTVGNDVVIAAVSDGAGSKANSADGSLIVCKKAVKYLKEALTTLKWGEENKWPDSKTWNLVFRKIVALVQGELGRYAKEESRPFDSLAATLMVLLVTPGKSYFAHVGDGRAGVLTPDGWKAVMTPHTGAESNQTVFMTHRILDPGLEISGVPVPETAVLEEPVTAFVLMSDGLEHGFWIKNRKEILPDGDFRYRKMNLPFEPALNDVLERVSMCEDGKERDLFLSILDHYNAPLKSETDDKTLCLAYYLTENVNMTKK